MSKRAGTYVTIEEVLDEVGLDVARFFFLMHGQNTHMDFNLDLAKEKSEKNPVFYVQYAHARIASIIKKTKKLETKKNSDGPQPSELALIKLLLQYPEMIREVTNSYEVQKVPFYALELARTFHDFYTKCRVIDNDEVIASRLVLVHATKKVLAETLGLMGISTPESM
jgi:arginyl-tRNA synthetase